MIYDLTGKEQIRINSPDYSFIFLDDKKLYIPARGKMDVPSIAAFISQDTLFTERGYNASYKCDYVKKNWGSCYDPRATPGVNYLNFEYINDEVFVYGHKKGYVRQSNDGYTQRSSSSRWYTYTLYSPENSLLASIKVDLNTVECFSILLPQLTLAKKPKLQRVSPA